MRIKILLLLLLLVLLVLLLLLSLLLLFNGYDYNRRCQTIILMDGR